MSEWSESRLEDLCDRITVGFVGKMADQYVDEGVPFLRSQNIKPFRIDPNGIQYIGDEFHQRIRKSTLRSGDVAVIRTGYPGTAAVVPQALHGSNCADLVVITPSENLNPHILAAVFNSTWGQSVVNGQLVGSAQQHFNVGSAKSMVVRLPNRPEQDRIAVILCSLNDLIENSRRRIAVLEEMAHEIYREWFVHFRYPGHEDATFVDSTLGPIPEDWDVNRLAELATVVRGRSYRKYELVEEGGLPFVNLKCMIRGGGFRLDGLKRYDGVYKPEQLVDHGDIVLAVTDLTQGREILAQATLVPRLAEPKGVISLDVTRIVPDVAEDRLPLFFGLRCSDFADRVKEYTNGSTVLHLSPKHVEANELIWPERSLREDFVTVVAPMVAALDELRQSADVLAAIRDLLLPKLVTGEIDVSELDLDALVEAAT